MGNAARILLCGSASILASCGVAFAQGSAPAAADQGEGGEIVVTATRSSASINKVPLSISAYGKASLDQKGVRDISDIVRVTPGLVFEKTTSTSNLSIRGVSSVSGAATTGVYIDDTPIQVRSLGYSGGNPYPLVFDLERVEVLRGPQGTLFGGGSMGGTVRFITPRPPLSGDTSVYGRSEVSVTQGGAANYEAGVAVGAPIVEDKLAVRASGWYRRDGGYIDRMNYDTGAITDKNSNWSNSYAARLAVAWAPTENLTITPAVYFQKYYKNGSDFLWENLSDRKEGRFINANSAREFTRDKFVMPTLNVEYDFGDAKLVAVASYLDRKEQINLDLTTYIQKLYTGFDFPTIPDQVATSYYNNTQKAYSGEVRLQSDNSGSRLRWLIGAFWSKTDQTSTQQIEDLYFPTYIETAFGVPYTDVFGQPLVNGRYVYDQVSKTRDEQISGFGQLDWDATDKLTLTAGVRVARTKFAIDANVRGPVVFGPPAIDSGSQTETPITPKFGITFKPDSDNLFYATVAKGFRPGGYNPAVGASCGAQLASIGLQDRPTLYNSDSVWSYEVGSKNSFFNRALQVQASAYRIDWSDIQQRVDLNQCGFRYVSNLGSARSLGFDLQAELRASPSLTMNAAVGYTSAKFRETVYGGPTAQKSIVSDGDSIAAAPWNVTLGVEYKLPFLHRDNSYIRADYNYSSHQTAITPQLNPDNTGTDPLIPNRPATHFVSLRAGTRVGKVDLSAFVQNLLDESAWTTLAHDTPSSQLLRSSVMRPRTFGLTAVYRY